MQIAEETSEVAKIMVETPVTQENQPDAIYVIILVTWPKNASGDWSAIIAQYWDTLKKNAKRRVPNPLGHRRKLILPRMKIRQMPTQHEEPKETQEANCND